jgi:NAD(P)-dependent dehydrogenase (short-subunit alcohol dehydrogenase family)
VTDSSGKEKVWFITGCSTGFGRELATAVLDRGARCVVTARRPESVRDIAAGHGDRALVLPLDVTEPGQVELAVVAAEKHFGRIDVLVNNAGIAHVGTVENTAEADFDRIYAVNVKGVYLCAQAGVRQMLKQTGDPRGGAILNLASILSSIGVPDRFAYSMSKGAVLTMTRSIAVDFIKQGIRCNCVCPARVHTPFVDGYLRDNYPGREQEMYRTLSEYQPIGRMGEPHEVAALARYLCSDEASFITGQAYPIDGGVLAF